MTQPPAHPSARTLLSDLTRSLDAFRAHREEAPLHLLVVFLHIAQRKGVVASELMRLTGLSQASVSRSIRALGQGKAGEPGLGLVLQTIDHTNTRARVVRLTPKGVELAKAMVSQSKSKKVDPDASAAPQLEQAPHLHWENWMD